MASATGIPGSNQARNETEPLLGQPGDVTQKSGEGFHWNIVTGTATIAQAGIWILTALIWSAVFEANFSFFSYHPLLNSAGILILVQSALLLQPTASQKHKVQGTYVHSVLNLIAVGLLVAGLVIIEINKAPHPDTRFQAVHGILGLVVYILIVIQALVGAAQFYFPALLFGSVDNGKKLYKYHRASGYLILVLSLVTICLVVDTKANAGMLHLRLWSLLVASILVVVGMVPRVKKSKFGF